MKKKRILPITDRQREVLDFIRGHIAQKGVAPSIMEIANHFEVALNTISTHLHALEMKGYVRRIPNIARGLLILEREESAA